MYVVTLQALMMGLTQLLLLLAALFDTVTTLTLGAYGTSYLLMTLPFCC